VIVVDNFAGGGGASTGIEAALGRPCDFAINHDAEAIAMHRANHPGTVHFQTNVWDVNPRQLAKGRPVSLGWFSPDCTFHSKARGGKPFRDRNRARRTRGLAWLVHRWVKALGPNRPRVIMLENVEEFADWGPLNVDGTPNKRRRGETFRRWHSGLENLGYAIDMRELRACDYGAPTTRKRLFVIARCDGSEIVFPEAMHGPGLVPYRTAADCIDWSIPCPSIFERARPLADATLRRIARGVMRYVVNNPRPFIVPITHRGDNRVHGIDEPLRTVTTANRGELALIAPSIINTRNGERAGQLPRVRDVLDPFPTVTAQGSQGAVVAAFLAQHNGGYYDAKGGAGRAADLPLSSITTRATQQQLVTSHVVKLKGTSQDGQAVSEPLHTVQAGGQHYGEVRAFLLKWYGNEREGHNISAPIGTVTTKDRFGLVTVRGEPYQIVDIGMRMLTPRELFRAQGFGDEYVIDPEHDGRPLTKTSQVRMAGNSVCPPVAEALVRANVIDQEERRKAA
jgi:DNA (cytosine-5)-methyltransferase 1